MIRLRSITALTKCTKCPVLWFVLLFPLMIPFLSRLIRSVTLEPVYLSHIKMHVLHSAVSASIHLKLVATCC